jgi:hypothetical protein
LRHGNQDGPDEAGKVRGNGDDRDVSVLALVKAEEFSCKPVPGLVNYGDDFGRLSLPSAVEDQGGSAR